MTTTLATIACVPGSALKHRFSLDPKKGETGTVRQAILTPFPNEKNDPVLIPSNLSQRRGCITSTYVDIYSFFKAEEVKC